MTDVIPAPTPAPTQATDDDKLPNYSDVKPDFGFNKDHSKVIYVAPSDSQIPLPTLTLDVFIKLCKVSLFHWSFGLILIPFFKTFFNISLNLSNPIFVLCVLQITTSVVYSLTDYLLREKIPKARFVNKWSQEVIVITGGSQGLGLLLAQSFAIKKAKVAILDIQEPTQHDMGFYYYECDVGNSKAVATALKEIKQDLGTPTVLINNAAVIFPRLIIHSNVTDIEKTIRVNLLSHFWTTKIVLPWMLQEDRGFIVTISSTLGLACPAQASAYGASKAGLVAYHEALHQEIHSRHQTQNIKTLLVTPGMMHTGMFDGVPASTYPRLFPYATPMDIVNDVIHHIEYNVSGDIGYPFYTYFAPMIRFCHLSVRRFVLDRIGANTALSTWKGREKGFTEPGKTKLHDPKSQLTMMAEVPDQVR